MMLLLDSYQLNKILLFNLLQALRCTHVIDYCFGIFVVCTYRTDTIYHYRYDIVYSRCGRQKWFDFRAGLLSNSFNPTESSSTTSPHYHWLYVGEFLLSTTLDQQQEHRCDQIDDDDDGGTDESVVWSQWRQDSCLVQL